MSLVSKLEVLLRRDLTRVHEASIKILEETGVVFQLDEAVEVFKRHGAKVSGQTVRIPREMLETALQTCPRSFLFEARNEKNSFRLGEGQDRVAISPNNGPVFIEDLDNGRRPGTLQDFVNIAKLCQMSEVVSVVGHVPVEPSDVEPRSRYLRMIHALLKHTDKCLIGVIRPEEEELRAFEMLEIAFGEKGCLRDRCVIGVSVNPLSPLRFGTEPCETMLTFAKHGQPVFILPCILAGATGPISLLGTAVLQNTEMLAGLTLIQLVNPGNPVVLSPASSVANMKNASYITGSPEAHLINIAGLQMVIDLYRLPSRTMAGLTDSKVLDIQAGYETMQNFMMVLLSGVHLVNESLGVLDSIMTTSYEKFVIDEEMIRRVLRISEGIDTSDSALSVDIIQEVGHSGDYLSHPDTFKNFKGLWRPTVSCWDSYDEWKRGGCEDIVVRANRLCKERLGSAPESVLDTTIDSELERYMQKLGI